MWRVFYRYRIKKSVCLLLLHYVITRHDGQTRILVKLKVANTYTDVAKI